MSEAPILVQAERAAALIHAARAAFEESEAQHQAATELELGSEIARIREALAKHGLEPCAAPFKNWASNRVCVPLVAPGWDLERETQIHAVAAEWDSEAAEHGVVLVADDDVDEGWDSRRLYPAGRLTELTDLGRAIERGGRPVVPPALSTAAGRVQTVLSRAAAPRSDDASGIQTCLEAVCLALLDIADAVRETTDA